MKTSFVKYGRKDDKDLCEITLENDYDTVVKLLNYGATLEKILINGRNMILSLDTPEDYSKERNFLGGTVGRIAGRIRRGQWKHGSEIHQLPLNDGENHIHGGIGTDMKVWDFKLYQDDTNGCATAKFNLFDPNGNNGYPGNLNLEVTYILDNEGNLTYSINMLSDKLTIANPVNHTYFTLGERAENLSLKLNADYYLPVDTEGLPDPKRGMEKVAGTAFDFRTAMKIGDALHSDDSQIRLRNGLDHPFILNGKQPAATLRGNYYMLQVTTNTPALVLYTGNHFDHSGIAHNIGQYDGITFEAQYPPASGSNLDELILMPDQPKMRTITWHFEEI